MTAAERFDIFPFEPYGWKGSAKHVNRVVHDTARFRRLAGIGTGMLHLHRCTKPTIEPQNTPDPTYTQGCISIHSAAKKDTESRRDRVRGLGRAICRGAILFLREIRVASGRRGMDGGEYGPRSSSGSKLLRTAQLYDTRGLPGTDSRDLLRDFVLPASTGSLPLFTFSLPPVSSRVHELDARYTAHTQRSARQSATSIRLSGGSFVRSFVHACHRLMNLD